MAQVRLGTPAGRWILLATICGFGMTLLDATVVTIALPEIGRDLDADFATLQWIVNAYALTLAAFIMLAGAVGDRFGRRRVFLIGAVWFGSGSLLCALAPTTEVLIASRAIEGIGEALLTPASLAIISSSFVTSSRAKAIGIWSGLGVLFTALGPLAAGWLLPISWRAVFLINLPVALLAIVVALRRVPESRNTGSPPGLDLTGALLTAVGLTGLSYALTRPGGDGGGDGGGAAAAAGTAAGTGAGPVELVIGIGGIAALLAFVVVEYRSPHPLVPLDLFRDRRFTVANLITLLVYAGLGLSFFLLVLQLQLVSGFSPLTAGIAMLPVPAFMLLVCAPAGALADRIGSGPLLIAGSLLIAGGFLLSLRIGPGASYLPDVLPAVSALGLGLALTVAPLTAAVLGSAGPQYAGTASGVNNAINRTGALLAVAVIPTVAGLSGNDYTRPAVFNAGFHRAMVIGAVLLVLSSLLSATLLRTARSGPAHAPEPEPIPPDRADAPPPGGRVAS